MTIVGAGKLAPDRLPVIRRKPSESQGSSRVSSTTGDRRLGALALAGAVGLAPALDDLDQPGVWRTARRRRRRIGLRRRVLSSILLFTFSHLHPSLEYRRQSASFRPGARSIHAPRPAAGLEESGADQVVADWE